MIITHNGTILTNDGVVLNNIITSPSFINTYSLEFDGMDDYVDVGEIPPLFKYYPIGTAKDSPWSASMWVKGTSGSFLQLPYTQINSLYSGGFAFAFTGTYLYFGGRNIGIKIRESEPFAGGSTAFNAADWNHIVMTFDGVDYTALSSYKLYVNGVLIPTELIPTNITDWRIKSISIGGPLVPWLGNIDEVSLFGTELSDVNVSNIYNGGIPTDLTPLNPIAWYRMGDNGAYKDPQWLIPSNENKDKVSNYSMNFDGVNDYVNSNYMATTSLYTSGFTISAWVNPDTLTNRSIVGQYSGGNRFYFRLYDAKYWVGFGSWNGGIGATAMDSTVQTGIWQNIILTYNPSDTTLRTYRNGIFEGSQFKDLSVLGVPTSPLNIGNSNNNGYFDGNMGDVAIFPRVVTPSEITTISTAPTDLTPLNPIAWWKLGENATYKSPQWLIPNDENKDKVSNYSMAFDGLDDYVDCGSITSLSNVTNFSYSGWYNQPTLDVRGTMLSIPYLSSNQEFILFYTWNDGRMILQIGDSGVNPYASFDYSLYVTAGQWFHFAYVYNGSGVTEADKVQIYINGAAITLTFSGTMHTSTPVGANITKISSTIYPWGGGVDEVAFFDYSLTAAEALAIGGTVPTDLSLLATPPTNYYKMGENATYVENVNPDGTWTIPDEVGTNDGTSNNVMSDSARVGDAPNSTNNGLSSNMTIEDRIGESPNTTNNALSYNMDLIDRVEDTPTP